MSDDKKGRIYSTDTHQVVEFSINARHLAETVQMQVFNWKMARGRFSVTGRFDPTLVYLGEFERRLLRSEPVPGYGVMYTEEYSPFTEPIRSYRRVEPPQEFLLGLKIIPVALPHYCQIGAENE
jgi:hypothetical protein